MTKDLYIIRHAKSSWDDMGVINDIDRPLIARGVSDAAIVAQKLKQDKVVFDKIVSSTGIRALHTATIMARQMCFNFENLELTPTLYHPEVDDVLEVIQNCDDAVQCLALFSHNPCVSDIAYKGGANLHHVSTNGVLHFKLKSDSWKHATLDNLEFVSYLKPKDLR